MDRDRSRHRNSPIPPAAQLVLDFFDNELVDVQFPGISQATMQAAAENVEALAEEVERAEAALAAAQQTLGEGQELLLLRCQRALAYARVYAAEDDELSRRLQAIVLGAPDGSRVSRKGRRTELAAARTG